MPSLGASPCVPRPGATRRCSRRGAPHPLPKRRFRTASLGRSPRRVVLNMPMAMAVSPYHDEPDRPVTRRGKLKGSRKVPTLLAAFRRPHHSAVGLRRPHGTDQKQGRARVPSACADRCILVHRITGCAAGRDVAFVSVSLPIAATGQEQSEVGPDRRAISARTRPTRCLRATRESGWSDSRMC